MDEATALLMFEVLALHLAKFTDSYPETGILTALHQENR